ncbi:MAG: peptidylprolyl isomerase [candidate division Zixibacteria bacterium]|nr:peptidylprolyl isomerase [candidate division Zixibacteria bacterium]
MSEAKNGDKVKVHYTGTFDDGTVFDTSREREPLEFTLGEGGLIPGFESGVMGMTVGASKTVSIEPENAYGPVREELIATVDIKHFPPDVKPAVGQHFEMQRPDGNPVDVVITKLEGEEVTLDANHPLAGKKLTFEIELVEIV